MKRTSALVGLALAASTVLIGTGCGGCGWTGYMPASFKATAKTSTPAETGKSLSVESGNGAIEVETWESKEVQVEATIRATSQERLDKTSVKTVQENGKIIISVEWPEGKRLGSEGADLVIHVPKVDGANLKTSNGHIKANGVHGNGVYHTSNGAVTVVEQDGPVDASTSNGKVHVIKAHGSVKVDTSNGAVDVSLDDAAKGPVDIDSSNGSVTFQAGAGFTGTLDASTSNGSCTLIDKSGTTKGKTLSHSFGSGEGSKIKTSNGSVTVNVAAGK